MKVFITGGCGSIGRALLSHYYNSFSYIEATVFSRDEYKHALIKKAFPEVNSIIGDIRDFDKLKDAMRGHDTVVHAAALKRIEICETNVLEAVQTNVVGTSNVVRAARENEIGRLVSLSTDKAVDPINIYGMTKKMQEEIVLNAGYNCTRYGNIFGSRGSVVEIFHSQAQAGKPLTVTNPDMTRFILDYNQGIKLISKALECPIGATIIAAKSKAASVGDIAKAFSDDYISIPEARAEKKHECLVSKEETSKIWGETDSFYMIGQKKVCTETVDYTSDIVPRMTIDEIKQYIEKWKGEK